MAKSAAKSDFVRQEARALSSMWILPYIHNRSTIVNDTTLLTPVKRYA